MSQKLIHVVLMIIFKKTTTNDSGPFPKKEVISQVVSWLQRQCMGLLPDTQNCRLRMHREHRERFPHQLSDPVMHHGTCVMHVPWYMSGSLTSGFLWSRWRGKRSRHFRCMHNPHFYVSGKRPMTVALLRPPSLIINLLPSKYNNFLTRHLMLHTEGIKPHSLPHWILFFFRDSYLVQ